MKLSQYKALTKNRATRVALIVGTTLAPLAARATGETDPISQGVTLIGGIATLVGAGVATVLAVRMIFVGIAVAKRLMGKV